MKFKKFNIALILFHFVVQFSAQTQSHDSISRILASNIHDTLKCTSLMNYIESGLEETVWPIYNDKLILLSKQAVQKSTGQLRRTYSSYLAIALSNKGYNYNSLGDFLNAKKYYGLALEIQKNNKFVDGIGSTYINLGFVSKVEGNVPLALEYYHSALKIATEQKDTNQAATAYNNMAYVFNAEGEYMQALNYYERALALHTKKRNLTSIATVLNNISHIYSTRGDVYCKGTKEECLVSGRKKALLFLERAIEIEDSLNNKVDLAGSLNVLGGYYSDFGDSECYGKKECIQSNNERVLKLYKKALALRIETNHTTGIVLSYHCLAEHMFLTDNLKEAQIYGEKCYTLAKKIGTPEFIKDAAKILSDIYKKQKKYTQALSMYELHVQKSDSLNNNSFKKAAIKKGFQIEYEKKAAADSIKVVEEKKVTDIQLKQETNQRYFLYGSLGLTILFAAFMVNRFRVTSKQKKLIELQKKLVEDQKNMVDIKQKEILDSIHYAKRIQTSLLPSEKYLDRHLKNKT